MTVKILAFVFVQIVPDNDDDQPSRPSFRAAPVAEEAGEKSSNIRPLAKVLPTRAARKALGA